MTARGMGVFLALLALLGAALARPHAAAQRERSVVIAGSGDLLFQPRVVSAARAAVDGFDRVMSPVRVLVPAEHVAFANLETPLSEEIPPESGSPPVLGAPPELAGALARAGIDVVSIANNHAWDQGALGAARTLEAVRAAGVIAIGGGASLDEALAPRVIERHGVRIAFVGVTERVNAGPGHGDARADIGLWDEAAIERALTAARASADVVVVSIHWSHDFWPGPRLSQEQRARFLVDHGADVILGHGPHVLQPVARLASPRGEAVVAYSLGNLVSNQGFAWRLGRPGAGHPATWRPDTRDGAWLRVRVSLERAAIRIGRLEAVPLFTYNNYFARDAGEEPFEDIRVQRLADAADPDVRAQRRATIAASLGDEVTLVER